MSNKEPGYVYILTNPSFREDWVKIGKLENTVSEWCTNTSQPDMETLARISKLLNVGIEDLYNQQFIQSM